ncbi:MAG: response regulator [Pseudomonadota bacterium]|nr:response regulator [Pseudomonadota bacterium]
MIKNILVVDDSQVDRSRLERLLSSVGYQVAAADNGQAALDAVKKSKPDLILMDVNMPVMDGFAATRALRGDAATKDIPVVMVTAKDQKADKAWGQMLGAKGYVTKPFTDEDVLSVVRSL